MENTCSLITKMTSLTNLICGNTSAIMKVLELPFIYKPLYLETQIYPMNIKGFLLIHLNTVCSNIIHYYILVMLGVYMNNIFNMYTKVLDYSTAQYAEEDWCNLKYVLSN